MIKIDDARASLLLKKLNPRNRSIHVSKNARTFTLVELLIVISIIALLAALLLPVLKTAKDKGKEILCLNNLRQSGMFVTQYAGDYQEFVFVYTSVPFEYGWLDNLYRTGYLNLKNRNTIGYCPTYSFIDYGRFWMYGFYSDDEWEANNPCPFIRVSGYGFFRKLNRIASPSKYMFVGDSCVGILSAQFPTQYWWIGRNPAGNQGGIHLRHSGGLPQGLMYDGHAAKLPKDALKSTGFQKGFSADGTLKNL